MSDSFNLDIAAEHVKTLVDSLRCIICDKTSGSRVSYPCGDSVCSECAETAPYCLLCLTPPLFDEATVPVLNKVLTSRVKNATDLLHVFEDLFCIDIVRRQRTSGQLKLEKELFPDCIQAPLTYHNIRKSDNILSKSKVNKNHTVLPGEIIGTSDFLKMNKSKNYVQDWLDEHETELFECKPRKPFSDLKVNTPKIFKSTIKTRADIIIDKVKVNNENQSTTVKSRKRSHFKTAISPNKSNTHIHNINTKEKHCEWKSAKKIKINKCKAEMSSINLISEPIIIEDSQVQDKDALAWLAVLKAHDDNKNLPEPESSCEMIQNNTKLKDDIETILQKCSQTVTNTYLNRHNHDCSLSNKGSEINYHKVPFYKKSKLAIPLNEKHQAEHFKVKDVSITIETQNLITNIKVTRTEQEKFNKHSKHVQTGFSEEININFGKSVSTAINNIVDNELNSQDLFTGEPKHAAEVEAKINNNSLIIESSDSEHEQSSILIVEADVHNITKPDVVGKGILTETQYASSNKIKRAIKRVCSPRSSNSSDKENRDPNTMKRRHLDKKKRKKKLLRW